MLGWKRVRGWGVITILALGWGLFEWKTYSRGGNSKVYVNLIYGGYVVEHHFENAYPGASR